MAVADDHHPPMSQGDENRCAAIFCLTWLGFFAAIGAVTWLLAAL